MKPKTVIGYIIAILFVIGAVVSDIMTVRAMNADKAKMYDVQVSDTDYSQ